MLVQNSVYVNRYIGNGVTTKFAFQFPILDAAHLKVVKQISAPLPDGVVKPSDEVIVPATEYTVTGVGVPDGGEVTFKAPPASGEKIALVRDTPITQLYQYTELDSFPAESHENALAKLTLICQELAEELSRAIVVGVTDGQSPEDYIDNFWKAWEEVLELYVKIQAIMNNLVCQTIEPFTTKAGVRKYYVGDGLPLDPKLYNLFLTLGGVAQEPKRAFTIVDESHIEFTENPPAGLRCWGISTVSTSTPDLRQMVQDALSKLAYATTTTHGIMMVGDGLSVSKGRVSVDFSEMPTDKFEALLKQIRVPIWLDGNKNFYVNGATGSDTLDEGRGESEGKPFKTLQKCIDYVCDNYNISKYTLSIFVKNYKNIGNLILKKYNSTSGHIEIVGNSENKEEIVIQGGIRGNGCGEWHIKFIKIKNVENIPSPGTSGYYAVYSQGTSSIYVVECAIDLSENISGSKYALSSDGGNVYVLSTGDDFYGLEIKPAAIDGVVKAIGGGVVTMYGDIFCDNISVDAATVNVNQGAMFRAGKPIGRKFPVFSGVVTGKRFVATLNGIISVDKKGPDFIPGTEPGTTSNGGQYL